MAKGDVDRRILDMFQAMIVYDSTTTSAGNAGGMSIIDSTLIGMGANSYLTCTVIINPGVPASFDAKPVASFDNTTGEVTVSAAFKGGQVAADVRYMIVAISSGGASPPPVTPSIGLWMFGVCDPGMTASTTTLVCTNLAGFPDDIFNGEFWVQVIHNDDSPGSAPEGEWRKISDYDGGSGTFTTDAFTANVEENDLLAIVHESIVSMEILGTGTLDTSSATVPADSTRTEGNDYFKGCLLMTTEGAVKFQPRPIRSFASGVFTLDEPFTAAPGLVDYIIISSDYPVQRLLDIFNIVNALLLTSETGDTLTADGTEQTLYINNTPRGVYEPLIVQVDCTNMAAGDVIVLREYYRIASGGSLRKKDEVTLAGAQDPALKNIELEPNRYGVQVTLEQTAGTNRDYDWNCIYRE